MNKEKEGNVHYAFTKEAHDAARRSLLKTLSWRGLASIDTFAIAWLATGNVTVGATIVSAEIFTKMVLYYLHERGWAHIRWGQGKKDRPQAEAKPAFARFEALRLRLARRKAA